jgi:putative ABC transport system permease protein
MLTVAGIMGGVCLLYGLLLVAQPIILSRFGLLIGVAGLSSYELMLISAVCLAGLLIGAIPAYRIYRYSLADGMTIRI